MRTLDRIKELQSTIKPKQKTISISPLFAPKDISADKRKAMGALFRHARETLHNDGIALFEHNLKFGVTVVEEVIKYELSDTETSQQHRYDIHAAIARYVDSFVNKDKDGDIYGIAVKSTGDLAKSKYYVDLIVKIQSGKNDVAVLMRGSVETTEALMAELEAIKEITSKGIVISTVTGYREPGMFHSGGFNVNRSVHPVDETMTLSEDAFYPFLKDRSVVDFAAEFAASKANVLLCYGPPGNGKSTFARTLAVVMGYKNIYSCSDERLFANNAFAEMINQVEDGTIFFLEDAFQFLKKRIKGNMNMSALLAVADGVAARNIKFVITTNMTTTDEIEPALIRDGRCFGIHEFKNLSYAQANAARASVGLPKLPRSKSRGEMSLATALNIKVTEDGLHAADAVEDNVIAIKKKAAK